MATPKDLPEDIGGFIRDLRQTAKISLRQLADKAGVSNPYLSQIERGLRKPSAEILQQIAKGLRVSAEALYVQAGILEHREGGGQVADAILTDAGLNERQKQVLLEIYDSFRKENAAVSLSEAAASTLAEARPAPTPTPAPVAVPQPDAVLATDAAPAAPRRPRARRKPAAS